MSLDHLIFDTTDFDTIDDTHSVGAFVRSGDAGALITHHATIEAGNVTFGFVDGDVTVGTDLINEVAHGLQTGDVVQLTTTGVLPTPLATATDYYVIRVDADNFKLAASAKDAERSLAIDITAAAGGGTHTVTEQEVNRRALDVWMVNPIDVNITQADEITVFQGTDPWVIGDGGGSITVDAIDLDIRDITHVSDSIKIGDGTDFLAIAADGSIAVTDNGTTLSIDDGGGSITVDGSVTVNDAALANTSIANAVNTLAVASTSEDVVASPLSNRKYLYIYNNDKKKAYIGATGVTIANGFPISPGALVELRCGAAIDIEWVSPKLAHEIRTLELS